ncbi:right-handed parallel beta-helix repeat-containing protein [Luteolibacter luteus]|uniref:Right-handed parallel beta-helix repeat-containing protein n=1 Tax=Luteolibacter luteus TaxID=2728835 RepID=A0A858RGN9_9BACT|nr:right-handed parallel beta-helix repeat-containing protein [Luteolibacter luteus]QJE95450.1 right-handed parallel beta-helix repeat-containing protein [Luteolibacter luteus]
MDPCAAADHVVTTQEEFEALNSIDFEPGDRILLAGGSTFTGSLIFGPNDSGTDEQGQLIAPIILTSLGEERATISAGDGNALLFYNAGGIEVSRLNLTGSGVAPDGMTTSTGSGLTFYTDSEGDLKYRHLRVDEVDVSGFGSRGLVIGGYNGNSGYDDVRITRVHAHHNLHSGIETFGFTGSKSSLANVTVSECVANDQAGDPASTVNTGSGITLGGVTGGLIEHCVAYGNGANNQPAEGPIGIWAYHSSNVVIQHNESHHNVTSNGDGGGFDLDIGVTQSVMQYNYSHDNAGAGFLVYGKSGSSGNADNVVRYNVSENDGRDPGSFAASGICVCDNIDDLAVYGNTVLISAAAGITTIPAIKVMEAGNDPDDIVIANNIFVSSGDTRLVYQDSDGDVRFAGNNYWSSGDNFVIRDNGSTYSSLSSWRSSKGQEKLSGKSTGSTLDPLFDIPDVSIESTGNSRLAAFRLRSSSPLISKGLNLKTSFGIDTGPRDLFGGPSLQGTAHEVGAHELAVDPPKILGTASSPDGPGIVIRYQSEIGVSFAVRRSNTLTGDPETEWPLAAPTGPGNGLVLEYVDTPLEGGRYFYVLVRE